jgi:uncharacterized protein (TIGR02145 family)
MNSNTNNSKTLNIKLMRKKLILSALLIASSFTTFAQVGIDTTDPKGVLDIVSTNSGIILSRVANTSAITSPVNGMLVYDMASKCIKVYQNSAWSDCLVGGSGSDTDITTSTGKTWMDRNLGAAEVAASSTDPASYGDLYQWGRAADGHEKRTSVITAGPVAAGSEGANFITSNVAPYDWLSTKDDTRWGATKTAHDPCPTGYRLPTEVELDAERLLFSTNNASGAHAYALKLPAAGFRYYHNGTVSDEGILGCYWSSTAATGGGGRELFFNNNSAGGRTENRANGYSVRCIKE